MDESAGSDTLRLAIAQVTRTHTVGPVVETIGPNSKRSDERQEGTGKQDKIRDTAAAASSKISLTDVITREEEEEEEEKRRTTSGLERDKP